LEVYINGVRRQTISGTVGWTLVTLNLDFGSNVIEWRYTKDGSVNVGEDRGYVDDISYIDATTLNPGIITGVQSICAGETPATLHAANFPQVYSPTANYQWQESSNGISGWTNITGETFLTYFISTALTQTRYYRRRTQDLCGNTDYSNIVEITVNQLPNGSLDGSTTICEGNSTNLSFNASAGTGPWDIIYNGIGLNTISSGTNISVSPTGNTTYTLSAITDNNGCVRTTGFVADASIIVHTNSTNPVIGSVANKQCPNTDIILTASSGVSGTGASIEWYTGPNGTGSNLGSGANITVNPSSNTTYYARREGACNTTSDASQVVDVRDFVYAATGISSSAGYCTDKDGWHHFYNTSDEIIFSLQGDLSGATSAPIVTINNHGTYHQGTVGYVGSCNVGLSPGEQFFEMQRAWNVDFTGTLNPPYSLRSYFPAAEKNSH
jgi:hypothetical protein